jgi:L-aspartate oxidase
MPATEPSSETDDAETAPETDSMPATTDVLVVGAGIAGLATAIAADRQGRDVTLVTKAERPAEASTYWAQGGIAVTRGDPDQLKQDVLDASAGTADPAAVDVLVEGADDAVRDVLLDTVGVTFDADGAGADAADADGAVAARASSDDATLGLEAAGFDFGQEAAHEEPRILHVDAATGKHVLVPMLNHVADETDVTVREDTAGLELLTSEGRVEGAILERDGDRWPVVAGATVLATGGIGACYPVSTNPPDATGDGIAMAALADADVADMAYVQFHPTVCVGSEGTDQNHGDAFLISEAVRGEGAVLRNADGERFMPDVHPDAELAPRDVVARAVERERQRTGEVTLDVSTLAFDEAFPALAETCEDHGVDWTDGIPVAPAEHFLCGGIDVDDRGRASLDGLYAVGECARTGVHGANRLASTSLLEGLVWGLRAGRDAADRVASQGRPDPAAVETPTLRDSDPALPDRFARDKFQRLRRVMGEYVGLERSMDNLAAAESVLRRLKGEVDAYTRTRTARSLYELRAASVVALLVARDAARREDSVGCHYLVDDESGPAEGEDPSPAEDAEASSHAGD